MEVITRASVAIVAAIFLTLAATFPTGMAVHVGAPAPALSPTNDGTTIDQGIAYVLMLVALILTYLIH